MESFVVRPVGPGDLESVVSLFAGQLREHDVESDERGLREAVHTVISKPHSGFLLLAIANGDPAGVAYVAALLSLEHAGITGWLEELYVIPELRSHGIGSRLLEEVVSRARTLGWRGIELEVMAGHERSATLYERYGFQSLVRSRFCKLFAAPAHVTLRG